MKQTQGEIWYGSGGACSYINHSYRNKNYYDEIDEKGRQRPSGAGAGDRQVARWLSIIELKRSSAGDLTSLTGLADVGHNHRAPRPLASRAGRVVSQVETSS
ncbi:hypothetical protein EVAR_37396_1 [Eumeta japonica]|uniref:Uncharacterized protein n=1 Tax=Eumeta variegata TaxID=151549 RepID=A0A4C1WHL2_EUMVA|nr:hypothetical protein EVAR_37396_1 [Eumeta japonica]